MNIVCNCRFHCISLIQWRKRNPDVKLVVKHKSQTNHIKAYWITSNDRNNDRPNNNPFTCFLTTFGDNDDSLYNIQQQMTFV